MLRGRSSINLDDKGRIAIPTRYREELQDSCKRQLVVTIAVNRYCVPENGCLWLYPMPEWEKVERIILEKDSFNPMVVNLKRFVIGNAFECEMDGQGRLLLPETLRDSALLEKKVVLLGQLNKFEIWNDEIWSENENKWMVSNDTEGLDTLGPMPF